MSDKYILQDKTPVICNDLLEWAAWIESADRTVAKTKVGEAEVSTVFLGLDHRFGEKGEPILFETMVFGGEHDQDCDRYSTWTQAEIGHCAKVAELRLSMSDGKATSDSTLAEEKGSAP